jgi:hypothetical protein
MRTVIIIVAGFVLWGLCLAVANFTKVSLTTATGVFVLLWLIAAAVNLWAGVTKAGYTFQEELPIFLLIFLLPTLVASFVTWKFW